MSAIFQDPLECTADVGLHAMHGRSFMEAFAMKDVCCMEYDMFLEMVALVYFFPCKDILMLGNSILSSSMRQPVN